MKYKILSAIFVFILCKSVFSQSFTEILGRPASHHVTMSVLFDQKVDIFIEYGSSTGNYSLVTTTVIADKDIPKELIMDRLSPDTRYYYRVNYKASGSSGSFLKGTEHTFQTCRGLGKTYTFAIEADPHLDSNSNITAYQLTLQNIRSKNPDFLIDMGDNFMSEKLPKVNSSTVRDRMLMYRPLWGSVCHSSPLFLVIGNHEGELGWKNNGTDTCMPVLTANMRKVYYPNPEPDDFYTGNSKPENFTGLLQDYYAWEWSDAQFIVINPYWYTHTKPDWGWTLGVDQYNWLKQTLNASQAKYRFIFCHQVVGGRGNDGRGGSEYAALFEMGGQNADSTWGFTTNRPGWEKPIHQLLAEHPATIYFHGHDHFFGKQQRGGVIYQELPQPSAKNITNMQATNYGYVTGDFIPSRGYVLVTVTDTAARVDYIRTYLPNEETAQHKNGEVAYSYVIRSKTAGTGTPSTGGSLFTVQNTPNPFRDNTTIRFSLAVPEKVKIVIYDLSGQIIDILTDEYMNAGDHEVIFHNEDLNLPAGIYIGKVTAGDQYLNLKLVIK